MTASRKPIHLFMTFALVLGLMPLPAFADDGPDAPEPSEGAEAELGLETAADAAGASEAAPDSGQAVPTDVSAVAFVYVESPVALADSVENIVVGFADEDVAVEAAWLSLDGPAGPVADMPAANIVEGAALFAFDTSGLAQGAYAITSLHYRLAGEDAVHAIDFAQDDAVEYGFEVSGASAQGADENGMVVEAYTVSPDGEYVQVGSIAEAMAEAGVDPEAGPSALMTSGSASDDGIALSTQASDGFVIVLDPGHGGYDGGATGIGFQEKDVNLKIAQYCKAKLEQTPGVTVYMTRSDDTYVSLSDRTDFAVAHNADLVVSLHNNAGGGSGSEVIVPRGGSWYYQATHVTGTELGEKILGKLNALGLGTHNGVYSRDCTTGETYPDGTLSDYYALIDGPRSNGILGIIVEHAFVDNASDAAFLSDDANLKKLGEADAQAIIEYYNSSEGLARLYWGVYDFDYYTSHYPSETSAYSSSKVQTLGYFKSEGMEAGHRGSVLFDVAYYKENNADLQKAYGDNLVKYYRHFLSSGMNEARQGSAEFNPRYYRANYPDLKAVYGTDWESYYKHYVTYGMGEGRVADALLPGASTTDVVFRLYNKNNGDHHYTTSTSERDGLKDLGWTYEGIAWTSPDSLASSTPVYRLYNPNSGDHHYTTDANERNVLRGIGWTYEGVAWYSEASSGVPLHRLYNKWLTAGTHHYTTDANERDALVKLGWTSEGIAWYGANE